MNIRIPGLIVRGMSHAKKLNISSGSSGSAVRMRAAKNFKI
jgi:hypothetical protein